MVRRPAAGAGRHGQPHAAVRGELDGVGQQVLQHLLQPLGVGDHPAAEPRVDLHVEGQPAALGLVLEGAGDHVEEVREVDLLGLHGHRARLDLRQVEDVGDQVEQVGAGAVDRPRELHLPRRQVAVGVVGQLLAEDQDAVERGAELVRHVGQELRLVLRGQGQLGGLVLERAPRLLDLLVLALDLDVLLDQLLRLLGQLVVGLLQLALLRLQLGGELLRLLQQPFGLHRRLDAVDDDAHARGQLLEERQVGGREFVQRGQAEHGLHLPLEGHREDDQVARQRLEEDRTDRHGIRRHVGDQDAAPIAGALADEAFPEAEHRRIRDVGGVGVAGQHLQPRRLAVHLVDDALVRVDERHQLGQQQLADRGQVALALQQAGETGEVGLQPVLLGVAVGGQPQVADHRVDVVLQLGDLAAGVDLDRSGQVALGHRGGHLGDGPHLAGEVLGQQVDVAGQLLPGAGGAGNVGLPAEPPLDADLAGHRRHLIGEGRQRAGHVVDGVGQRRHLALGLHGELLLEVAVGHRRDHLDDAADLLGEVGGHDVDGVGEVLPGAGDARHLRLAAEQALGADLAGDAGHLGGERVELVDHRVDGVLQLEDLALDVDGDLARQVAAGHRRGHLGDVAHLGGEVGGQQVDVVGQVLPGAGRRRAPPPGRRAGRRCRPRGPRASPRRRRSAAAPPSCSAFPSAAGSRRARRR